MRRIQSGASRELAWATQTVGRLAFCAIAVGVVLTACAGAWSGSQGLNSLTWLGTVATVAALLVALGIYRLQARAGDASHQQLLDRLDAQDDLLQSFAEQEPEKEEREPIEGEDALTAAQRAAIDERYGEGSIASAWKTGSGRGNRARLVRLRDGRIVSVYSGGRKGGTYVHEVQHRHGDS